MKLPCPHCKNLLPYSHLHAGKSFQCTFCKKAVTMPAFEKLPAEFQNEYRKELEKKKQLQEAEQKKQEAQKTIASELPQPIPARPEEEPFGQLLNLELHAAPYAGAAKLADIGNRALEGETPVKSYRALKRFPHVFMIFAGVAALLSAVYLIYEIIVLASAEKPSEILFLILPGIIYHLAAGAVAILVFLFMAQAVRLTINAAEDLKECKTALTGLAQSRTVAAHDGKTEIA
jgi:hypothetical protein